MKRRQFLKNSVMGASLMALAPGVMMSKRAYASTGNSKALVCIFLAGGNDSHNMFVPMRDDLYQQYTTAKGNIALKLEDLCDPGFSGDLNLLMHKGLLPLQDLFTSGKATAILNTGNLIAPGTKEQFLLGSVPNIPRRGSHSDMQHAKRRGQVDGNLASGWGGRLMDSLNALDTGLPPSYNINGSSNFLLGTAYQPALISSSSGLKEVDSRPKVIDAINADVASVRENIFRQHVNTLKREMLSTDESMQQILNADITQTFPTTSIGESLELVARLIKHHTLSTSEQSQQIFYITQGGYDTHKSQVSSQQKRYSELADALAAFQAEINNSDQVTTFTMSDFGRTLLSNGEGTGHGWAGHEMVIGGAVNGGNYYGNITDLGHLGEQSIDERGRMIPTISSDQVGATLAHWLGGGNADLNFVFPNLKNFPPENRNLGFLG